MVRKNKRMTALEWGVKHGSCSDALKWRESLGPNATQADAWKKCQRGDWLIWQFNKLPIKIRKQWKPALMRALDVIVARSVRKYALHCKVKSVRQLAKKWLSREDRSNAAAYAAECKLQVRDIHREIPEWPGED